MSNERVIEVLMNGKKCVLRNIRGCDRECGKCDLVLPDEEILTAYDAAIRIIQGEDDGK
jgi:hypothetical protein